MNVEWSAASPDDAFTRVHLYKDALVLAVPPAHRLADPAVPLDAATLREQTWIAMPAADPTRQALDRLIGGDLASPIRWEFEGLATIGLRNPAVAATVAALRVAAADVYHHHHHHSRAPASGDDASAEPPTIRADQERR